MLHFHINTQLKSLSQPLFVPLDGQLIQDLQRAWDMLEKAENRRETALRTELQRQERLEQLAYKFERKVLNNFVFKLVSLTLHFYCRGFCVTDI
jgi:spectrin beta